MELREITDQCVRTVYPGYLDHQVQAQARREFGAVRRQASLNLAAAAVT